jgi:hypothetical protein
VGKTNQPQEWHIRTRERRLIGTAGCRSAVTDGVPSRDGRVWRCIYAVGGAWNLEAAFGRLEVEGVQDGLVLGLGVVGLASMQGPLAVKILEGLVKTNADREGRPRSALYCP